jgi:hypothetical protein
MQKYFHYLLHIEHNIKQTLTNNLPHEQKTPNSERIVFATNAIVL